VRGLGRKGGEERERHIHCNILCTLYWFNLPFKSYRDYRAGTYRRFYDIGLLVKCTRVIHFCENGVGFLRPEKTNDRTERRCLRDALNGNVAISNVYSWRQSDIIVTKLTALLKNKFPTKCTSLGFFTPSPIHRGTGYCFRSISLFISFFVSLLARLRENGCTDLHEIFREGVE